MSEDSEPSRYPASTLLVEAIQLDSEPESLKWAQDLLKAGEDPNAFDHIAQTLPLEAAWREAAWEDHKSDTALKVLLESGADVQLLTERSLYSLDLIARGPVDLTLLMIEHGLDLSSLYYTTEIGERHCGWDNPLTMLLEIADFTKINQLEPFGILDFVHIYDELGDAPLGYFAREGNRDIADWLLKHGADINARNEYHIGNTALDRAIHEHDLYMIEFLLNRGANPNIPTWMWITATDRVSKYGSARTKGRHDAKKDADLVEIKHIVLEASKNFQPPTYPDGSTPSVWPPDPSSK